MMSMRFVLVLMLMVIGERLFVLDNRNVSWNLVERLMLKYLPGAAG